MKILVKDIWTKLGGIDVLRGVTLEISSTSSIALIGRNGAGKTTLLRTILGILKPYKGSIVIEKDGEQIQAARIKPYKIARLGIGYVPQGRMIFPDLTVEENLEVAYGSPVPSDVLEWIYTIMPDLKKLRKRLGMYLSGGEQQMLAIARALVRRPKILLLDEPLEGLAPRIVKTITKTLRDIKEEGVGLFITEPGNIKRIKPLIEKAYGIDRGEIVYSGDIDGILQDPVARRRIWGL